MEETQIKQIIEHKLFTGLLFWTRDARSFSWSALALSAIFWPEKLSVLCSCWFMDC